METKVPPRKLNFFYRICFGDGWHVDTSRCCGCSVCENGCPSNAITVVNGKARINNDICHLCCRCYNVCPRNAISLGTLPQKPQYHYLKATFVQKRSPRKPIIFDTFKTIFRLHSLFFIGAAIIFLGILLQLRVAFRN